MYGPASALPRIASLRCAGIFDVDAKAARIDELEKLSGEPSFWLDADRAQKLSKERGDLQATVEHVQSGPAALELLRVHAFTAIVTDYRMPWMDGLTLVRKIREMHLDMPIVMRTAMEGMEKAAKSAGVDYVLADDCEVYLTAKGAVLAANQVVRV